MAGHPGEVDAGAWSCGLIAGLIDDIPTVAELMGRIVRKAQGLVHERLAGIMGR